MDAGEFVSIVGPNGAGKTTLFKTLSGVLPPRGGRDPFRRDRTSSRVAPHDRPHLGIAHVPEGRQVFASLTVLENLEMGAYTAAGHARVEARRSSGSTHGCRSSPSARQQLAGTLSGGEQQMLAIGRGLASAPKLLMLDEPSMGLAPTIADFVFDKLMEIRRDTGLTILLVEQRVAEALQLADHGYVLETGTRGSRGQYTRR